jgi:hypothetical protein
MLRTVRVLLVFVAVLSVCAERAAAQIPSAGVYTACIRLDRDADEGKVIRLVAATEPCKGNETRITWNAQGQKGDTGPAGAIGPVGATGAIGGIGPIGPVGATGATGGIGPIGPVGATGATGGIGPIGPVGATGATGGIGPIGPVGATGATGGIGPIGPVGATGGIGPIGPAGANGATGGVGPTGAIGPVGATGATGGIGPAGTAGQAAQTVFGTAGYVHLLSSTTGCLAVPGLSTSFTLANSNTIVYVTTDGPIYIAGNNNPAEVAMFVVVNGYPLTPPKIITGYPSTPHTSWSFSQVLSPLAAGLHTVSLCASWAFNPGQAYVPLSLSSAQGGGELTVLLLNQ